MKYLITILFVALLGACQVDSPTSVSARIVPPIESVCVEWGWKIITIGSSHIEVPVCLRWDSDPL